MKLFFLTWLFLGLSVWAQDPLDVGSQLPNLPSKTTADVSTDSLAGTEGLVLVVFRSADW